MSFYNYYRYSDTLILGDVKVEEVSIELLNFNKIKETVKKVFKAVVDFFKRVFAWIKNKINKFFKSSVVKINANKLKSIKHLKSYKILKDIDVTDLVNSTLRQNISVEDIDLNKNINNDIDALLKTGPELFIGLIFDQNDNYNEVDKLITFIDDIYNTTKDNGYDGFRAVSNYLINLYRQQLQNKPIYTYGSVIGAVDKLPSVIAKAEKYYNEKYKELSTELNRLNNELNELTNKEYSDEDYNYLFNRIIHTQQLIKLITIPITCVTIFIYIIGKLIDPDKLTEYISIPYTSRDKLFHLSLIDILKGEKEGILYPKGEKPNTVIQLKSNSIFPNKICFSPSIENCCVGIFKRFDITVYERHEYLDLYVYEGMPDNTTKILNPKITSLEVVEYFLSQEIAVISSIKIRKVGKVRVYTDNRKDAIDPRGYLRYEFLEGEL